MRNRILVIAVALVLALLGAGIAYASIPGPDGTIHGCYKTLNPAQGALITIDSAASCPSGYTALNWNQTGPQGPPGPTPSVYTKATTFSAPGSAITTFTQNCNAGDLATGGGWRNGYAGVNVKYDAPSQPNFGSNAGWSVDFDNTNTTARDVEVHAVCLDVA